MFKIGFSGPKNFRMLKTPSLPQNSSPTAVSDSVTLKKLSHLGDSEEMLGRFLPDYDRDSFVIATKVGRYNKKAKDMFDFSYAKTISSGKL